MSRSGSRTPWNRVLVVVLATLLGATACGPVTGAGRAGGTTTSGTSGGSGTTGTGPAAPAGGGGAGLASSDPQPSGIVTTNAGNGLAQPVTVRVDGGPLSSVSLLGPAGDVKGTVSGDGSTWTSDLLLPGQSYTLVATSGRTSVNRTFVTAKPERVLTADVSPWGGQTVGVGQPIVVQLSAPVKDKAFRAAVEQALVVETSQDVGPASWSWISNTRLDYRPKEFWPANTTVTVHVNLAGVQAGQGLWGVKNRDVSFTVGRSFVMTIDNTTHTMTVTQDGAVVRTIPVSMGRKGYETRSGIKTVMSHERTVRMSSESYGGADFYDEIVEYAQRLTWSGEYIHAAPWSVYAQGKANVSHGCVNVSTANAIWLFKNTLVGDPVVTTGTNRQMEPGNGDGGDWQWSWTQWTGNSALSA